MEKKVVVKYVKIAIVCVIAGAFLWLLILQPMFTFKSNEKQMRDAAKHYFEINSAQLPTGSRVKTISLQELYTQAYLKDDFYIPFSKKACSVTESWVKVRRVDGKYKYYTYLKCGVMTSIVDHKGPAITLNGEEEVLLNIGEEYKEPGVKSVVDNSDGKMDIKDVTINSNEVNTKKAGTYEVTYTAMDSLNNKTVKVRKVKVVSKLKNTVVNATNKTGVYTGLNPNNYIYFSGMVYRIVDVQGDNVRIVAEQDISNVNYSAIDDWLGYYYEHLTKKSQKLMVDSEYCTMKLDDANVNSTTKCSSKSKSKKLAILSATDINQATGADGNYLYPSTISWVANSKDDKTGYTVRDVFFGVEGHYMGFDKNYNFGVRPVVTIKGDTLIANGDGTKEKPYSIGDFTYAKAKDMVNTRYSGEFIQYSGMLWRIIDTDKDGTTKVIANTSLYDNGRRVSIYYDTDSKAKIYNPKQAGNVGYSINNKMSQFVETDYFVNKEIKVPIYKKDILYGKEISTKKYKVKLSAPNMYELFSATDSNSALLKSYWLINSSQTENIKAVVSDIGVVMYGEIDDYSDYGVRPVGYLNKDCVIVRGSGTFNDPYVIAK